MKIRSVRFQLIITFVICAVLSTLTFRYSQDLLSNRIVNTDQGTREIENAARDVASQITNNPKDVQTIIDKEAQEENVKIYIANDAGNIKMQSKNAGSGGFDIPKVIRNQLDMRVDFLPNKPPKPNNKEYTAFYPLEKSLVPNEREYILAKGLPRELTLFEQTLPIVPFALAVFVFAISFYIITRSKIKEIEQMEKGLKEISEGNLSYRIKQKSYDELGSLANHINQLAQVLETKTEEEKRIEQQKNELITSVSHDLRTPLTSVLGYLRLIKEKRYKNEKEMNDFIQIVFEKSEKLKTMIEDLFEYTKLSDPEFHVTQGDVCLSELLEQMVDEFDSFNDSIFVKSIPTEKVFIEGDAEKIARVFENLFSNAVKYSKKPGEVKVDLKVQEDEIIVTTSNKGEEMDEEILSRIFERFYRTDKSRSSQTGGSGLGLAIAKSIIDLHGGTIHAKSEKDEISFIVKFKRKV